MQSVKCCERPHAALRGAPLVTHHSTDILPPEMGCLHMHSSAGMTAINRFKRMKAFGRTAQCGPGACLKRELLLKVAFGSDQDQ
eukprot:1677232-Pleurochrysis_carterae.AAC.1